MFVKEKENLTANLTLSQNESQIATLLGVATPTHSSIGSELKMGIGFVTGSLAGL